MVREHVEVKEGDRKGGGLLNTYMHPVKKFVAA
jgi:hypothetical protein